jgi:hypothetical protein
LKTTTTHKVPVRTVPLPPPLPWPNQKTWKWSDEQQNKINTMKRIIARETSILAYPNFKIPFEVHTDASAFQLGAVISQNGKPLAFYSRKLTPTQKWWYTTTERELQSIIETLKVFWTILL